MKIKGKVHLLFEQSGTFRDEFRKLGYEAECYDIQNQYGQTNHIIDLFSEIDRAYGERRTENGERRTENGERYHHIRFDVKRRFNRGVLSLYLLLCNVAGSI